MVKTVFEARKELPVIAEPDVLVVGGGPSGYVAAIAAARNGANTLLVERYGYLGGLATGCYVIYIDLMAHQTQQVIYGIPQEVIILLLALGVPILSGLRRKRSYLLTACPKAIFG